RAGELLDQIARQLQTKAEGALSESRFDDAAKLDEQALLATPDDAALKALKTRIADARGEAERKIAQAKQAADKEAAEKEAAERQASQAQAAQAAAAASLRERIGNALAATAPAEFNAGVDDFAKLYTANAADKETLTLRARLVEALSARLQKSASTA